ncbi:MAG: 16S rRNA (guanine(527)-N(7))-methyltransferase RsmG [Bacilli bacterium]
METNVFKTYLKDNFPQTYEELVEKFNLYSLLLARESKIHNLTALEPSEYDEKHFLDSLMLNEVFTFANQTLIDVGTGAGFPGLVLAIAFKDLKVTLLEPTRKRCDFLKLVVDELSLSNVTIINERAEDYVKKSRETFDVATSRAVASLPIILELSVGLVKVGGSIIVMKGKQYETELKSAKKALELLKIKVTKKDIHYLESDGSMRVNAVFTKISETSAKYPRAYGQIKKNPL